MRGWPVEPNRSGPRYWQYGVPALGVVLVIGAVAKSAVALAGGDGLLEAGIDLVLLCVPGFVLLSVGRWLPTTPIASECYPRIVAWIAAGVTVMGIVLGLRVLHPGVTVQFTFGTQAVFLAIGSLAGLGIGVHEARALTSARMLEARNERLQRTEDDLEEAVAQLEDSNERLEQFAYAASHDLQEPLRMVSQYLQLVERRYGEELDDDCLEFVEFAVDGADRMREMIEGLLEYSRVETQGGRFDAVDLDAVLDDVLADLQFRIEETDTEIAREPLPTVGGDARQLQQLFQNLVSNAIDYAGDDAPRIHVSAERSEVRSAAERNGPDAETDGRRWTVSIRDDGIGIDPDDADRIFDVFERLHSIDECPGSGIGLALCKRVVERHDGEIWVDSRSGEGSTFYFTLPPFGDSPEALASGRRAATSDLRTDS